MLEKIVNINSNFGLNKERRSSGFSLEGKSASEYHEPGVDSIVVSSGTAYLIGIGWKLKGLKSQPGEKTLINFIYDGFEFKTELDLFYSRKLNRRSLTIIKEKQISTIGFKILTSISIHKDLFFNDHEFRQIKMEALDELFLKIAEKNLEKNFTVFDDLVIQEMLLPLNDDLLFELTNINTALINYIEKLNSAKTIYPLHDSNGLNELKIEKIITTRLVS